MGTWELQNGNNSLLMELGNFKKVSKLFFLWELRNVNNSLFMGTFYGKM